MSAPEAVPDIGARPDAILVRHRPLDAIRHEHARQAILCDILDALSDARAFAARQASLAPVHTYLSEDLTWHTEDEEHDLFPMLRARCQPGDEIEAILGQLSREHALDRDLADFLCGDLAACLARPGATPPMRFFINARAFAETQRRHLGWENSLILPLARRRLSADDVSALGHAMAARRGLAPGE